MNFRRLLKRSQTLTGMVRDAKSLAASVRAAERWGPNSIAKRYFATHAVRKLEIGAGPNTVLPGWLPVDIDPISRDVMYMDATRPFPFPDGAFQYIYSEHMIEHVSWSEGLAMLRECRRVLSPNGVVRIATPDLAALLRLRSQPCAAGRSYISWLTDNYIPEAPGHYAAFAINRGLNGWGHQFVYDAETLTLAMNIAGFSRVETQPFGVSSDPDLVGLESHATQIASKDVAALEAVRYETMILECRP